MSRREGWVLTFLVSGGYAATTAAYMGVILTNTQTFALTMAVALGAAFVYRRWVLSR